MSCINVSTNRHPKALGFVIEAFGGLGMLVSAEKDKRVEDMVIGAEETSFMDVTSGRADSGMVFSTGFVCPVFPESWLLLMAVDGNYETSDGEYIMLKSH